MSEITPEIRRLQAHAFGIARDVAAAFETNHNDGSSSPATFRALADHLLTEPEVVRAITAWAKAIEREVDRNDGAARSEAQDGERTHAKRLLDRHCSLELRCTLSAHQDEWWRLNRDRELSQADILQVLEAGLRARRVEPGRMMSDAQSAAAVDALRESEMPQAVPGRCRDIAEQLRAAYTPTARMTERWAVGQVADLLEQIADNWNRRPAAGMNVSQGKPAAVYATPVLLETTAMWAGAQTAQTDGAVHFSAEAWAKFVKCLGEEPPLEILTSPGISAPAHLVHQRCVERGCEEAKTCPSGKCALGPGDAA